MRKLLLDAAEAELASKPSSADDDERLLQVLHALARAVGSPPPLPCPGSPLLLPRQLREGGASPPPARAPLLPTSRASAMVMAMPPAATR